MTKKQLGKQILISMEVEKQAILESIVNEVFEVENLSLDSISDKNLLELLLYNQKLISQGEQLYMIGVAESIIENSSENESLQEAFLNLSEGEMLLKKVMDSIPNTIEDDFSSLTEDTLNNL